MENQLVRIARIKHNQEIVGTLTDGFWGPKSITACQNFLLGLMPKINPWPGTSQRELQRFYGSPGDEDNLIVMPFPHQMYYDGKIVRSTRVHKKCADSLFRILDNIGDKWGGAMGAIQDASEDYGGCYNNRPMRNGSLPSLHARGAAIDLDADDNSNLANWPLVADMPIEIIIEFSREGWTCAGPWWHRDGMHSQATRPNR